MLGNLPLKMKTEYAALESEADALDLIDRALDALSSNAKLGAALDPDGTGVFDHYDSEVVDDAETDVREDQANFVDAAKTKVNSRTFAQMRGERSHKVIATLGTTSYTRFGAWRRESTANSARESGGVIRTHGGPGTFAYSPLDPTNAGTATNPGFPRGGSASYTGETVAIQAPNTILTGTVRVDVAWNSLADTDNGLNDDGDITTAGTMSLTISGLASAVGDPLSHGGSVAADAAPGPGSEIADIVLGMLTINVGAAGDNVNDLIVGTASSDNPDKVTYAEAAVAVANARLRFGALGMGDDDDSPSTASVKALFVGQGVDGPLGVIGAWTVQDDEIGLVSADGTAVVNLGTTIHGAFGAEAP